jgi:hypothetical protein
MNQQYVLSGYILLAILILVVVPASWRIASKAGYKPWPALLMIVSPINLILLIAFALSEWPIERERKSLREQQTKR